MVSLQVSAQLASSEASETEGCCRHHELVNRSEYFGPDTSQPGTGRRATTTAPNWKSLPKSEPLISFSLFSGCSDSSDSGPGGVAQTGS